MDLAAHTIVLAAARMLKEGVPDAGKTGQNKRLKPRAK